MSDVPERWAAMAADAASATFYTITRDDPDPVADVVTEALSPVLADLRRQVEAEIIRQREISARYRELGGPVLAQRADDLAGACDWLLELLNTGGSDG